MPAFEDVFRSAIAPRDKFLARLFGLFSEEVVRHWCSCPEAPYEDLGRPTLRRSGEPGWHTLDFTLQRRITHDVAYVAELKCELELGGYRYLRLTDPNQVHHHEASRAFTKFLGVARGDQAVTVQVGGRPKHVGGAVLIWGATTPSGVDATKAHYGFEDILSVEAMVHDLQRWQPTSWTAEITARRSWANELFTYLGSGNAIPRL